jgi:transcriptional regulator with XRE-family HTH domain
MASLAGDFLRRIRTRQGISQEELARRVGSHQPQLSAWESGRKPVTVEQLEKLMSALGLALKLDAERKPSAKPEGKDARFSAAVGDLRGAPTQRRKQSG